MSAEVDSVSGKCSNPACGKRHSCALSVLAGETGYEVPIVVAQLRGMASETVRAYMACLSFLPEALKRERALVS